MENRPKVFNFREILKHGILPLGFYFLLFCLLTYPLILKFSTHFFADGGDGLQNVWNIWWINRAVLRPDLYPSFWQTDMLHWPFGVTLYGQTLNPFNGLLGVGLLRFFSLTVTHNIIVIFAFVMGGMTMYWLAYYVTKSFWGSLIGGFIFTFSSYHLMHAQGHLQLVSLEWIPLFILCWISLLQKPRVITALGAGVVLWLVLLCDYYYFFYCIFAAVLMVLWYAVARKDFLFPIRKDHFLPLVAFASIVALLIAPIAIQLLLSNYRDPLIGSHEAITYSLDLLALVVPGGHWLFNSWTKFSWSAWTGNINESSVYLGVSIYAFLIYIWVKRKSLEKEDRWQVYLWSILAGIFLLLSFGPALHIGGKVVWDTLMPYSLLEKVLPFLRLSGVPVRMMVMVTLGMAVISAMCLRELFRQFPAKRVVTLVLLAILLFETLPSALPATRVETPDYVTALTSLPNDGGVLDLVTKSQSVSLYYQTIYNKPVVFGYVSRLPTSIFQREEILRQVIQDQDFGKLWDIYHIRYIITDEEIQAGTIPAFLTIKTQYDKNGIKIYRIECECEANWSAD